MGFQAVYCMPHLAVGSVYILSLTVCCLCFPVSCISITSFIIAMKSMITANLGGVLMGCWVLHTLTMYKIIYAKWQQYELCVINIVLQAKTQDRQVLDNVPKVLPFSIDKIRSQALEVWFRTLHVCALCPPQWWRGYIRLADSCVCLSIGSPSLSPRVIKQPTIIPECMQLYFLRIKLYSWECSLMLSL